MGRGLSGLQQDILCLTLEGGKGFLSSQEILRRFWGWQPQEWGSKKAAIGEAEYRSAHASLSRALTRLWHRGLIDIWKNITASKTAVSLTDNGVMVAHRIMRERSNGHE